MGMKLSELADKNNKVIILHESAFHSVIKDVITFGCIGLLAWFNHSVLEGGWVLDVFCIISGIISAWKVTPENMTRTTVAELLATVERSKQ